MSGTPRLSGSDWYGDWLADAGEEWPQEEGREPAGGSLDALGKGKGGKGGGKKGKGKGSSDWSGKGFGKKGKGKGSSDWSGKGSGQSTAWVERRRCHNCDQVGHIAVNCTQPKRRPGASAVSEASSAQTQAGKLSFCSLFQRQRIVECDNPEACASLGCGKNLRTVSSMRNVVLSSVPIVPVANTFAHLAVDTQDDGN